MTSVPKLCILQFVLQIVIFQLFTASIFLGLLFSEADLEVRQTNA